MSLATFKKKSVINYGVNRSAKPPGGYWLPQGPFGKSTTTNSYMLKHGYGPVGFSINGPYRSISVGKDMKFSKQGTRFRGVYPYGSGGSYGKYYTGMPVFNAAPGNIIVTGNQWEFIKPSSLSTKGMLEQKYKWAYNGQYPNNWVQPNYTGNQTDSASQGLYIQQLSAANDCVVDVNNEAMYVGHRVNCGSTGCQTTPARGYKMVVQQANAPYTKQLHIPQTSSQHTLRVQRKCANPKPSQKPFPFAVPTGTGILTGGIKTGPVDSSCGTSSGVYLTPPAWYVAEKGDIAA